MQYNLRDLAERQLESLGGQTRLIVIQPQYREAYSLRAKLLERQGVYLRLDGQQLDQSTLQAQFDRAMDDQWQDARLEDLPMLIIDEGDRAIPKEFDHFIKKLLQDAPNCRAYVFGRSIPDAALNGLKAMTAFIPHENEVMLWDYTCPIPAKHLLEIHAFGDGQVYLDGKHVQTWQGALPRALFFYLVDRGMVTRPEIFKTFWSRMNKQEATNVFHVTKRKIGEILGLDLTAYNSGYYHVAPEIEVRYDTLTFNWLVQNSAIAEPAESERLLSQAMAVYRGPFLAQLNMPWAIKRRHELAADLIDALLELGTRKYESEDDQGALAILLKAMKIADYREDLTATLMRVYVRLGQPADALKVYRHYADGLKREYHKRVSTELRTLAENVRKKARV